MDDLIQADFAVDLAHAFGVGLSGAYGTEYDVHFLEREAFGLGREEVDEEGAHGGEEAEEDVGSVGDAREHTFCFVSVVFFFSSHLVACW